MGSGVSITLISCKVILSGKSREGTENRLIIRRAVQDAYTGNGMGNSSASQFSLQTGAMWNSMDYPFCHGTAEMQYLVAVYTAMYHVIRRAWEWNWIVQSCHHKTLPSKVWFAPGSKSSNVHSPHPKVLYQHSCLPFANSSRSNHVSPSSSYLQTCFPQIWT